MNPDIGSKNTTPGSSSRHLSSWRWMLVCLVFAALPAQSAVPGWWPARGVTKTLVPNQVQQADYAVANQGQLKNFARAARDEMLAKGMISNDHPIDAMVDGWAGSTTSARDYAAVNLGQVKAVAKMFYDRLILVGLRPAGSYPWGTGSSRDYAAANIGQLKNVFSFEVPSPQTLAYDAGRTGVFWSATVSGGYVTQGILAGNQTLAFAPSGSYLNVTLKDATPVTFQGQYVVKGTLATDQVLPYGLHSTTYFVATLKAGTEFECSNYKVTRGTLGLTAQNLRYYTYDSTHFYTSFKEGAEARFANNYVTQGTLDGAADQSVRYFTYGSTHYYCLLEAGTEVHFASDNTIASGFLSADNDQSIRYRTNDSTQIYASFEAGTEIQFTTGGNVSKAVLGSPQSLQYGYVGNYVAAYFQGGIEVDLSTGYIKQGTLSGDQALYYGNAGAYRQASFKNGTVAKFTGDYVSEGVLSSDQPLYYGNVGSYQQASFKAGTTVKISGNYVSEGVLNGHQLLYYGYTGTYQQASFKDGTTIKISSNYVTEGVLNGNQLLYCGYFTNVYRQAEFQGGSQVFFSSNYVTKGTLSQNQTLVYGGYESVVFTASFKGSILAEFSGGRVTKATLNGSQALVYVYASNAYQSTTFKGDTEATFGLTFQNFYGLLTGTLAPNQNVSYNATSSVRLQGDLVMNFGTGYVTSGILSDDGADQTLNYSYGKSVVLKAGSSVVFNSNGYVAKGTLANGANQSLEYGFNTSVLLKGGQAVEFENYCVMGGRLADSPAANQSLAYGNGNVVLKAGTEVSFVNYPTWAYINNTYTEYTAGLVAKGLLAQDSYLRYNQSNDYGTVKLLANTSVEFVNGHVQMGTLATDINQQLRYCGSGSSVLVTLARGSEVTFVNQLVTGGILLGDQYLAYHPSYVVKLQGGQWVDFPGGFVTGGLLADSPADPEQLVSYGEDASYRVYLKKGTEVRFSAWLQNGQLTTSRLLTSGTLGSAATHIVYYRPDSGSWRYFQGGTRVDFDQKFLTRGTLAEGLSSPQTLRYSESPYLDLPVRGGTEATFRNMLVARCVLENHRTFNYGPSRSVDLLAGTSATFALLENVPYVVSGTANGSQTLLRAAGISREVKDGSRLEFVDCYLSKVYEPVDNDDLPDAWEWDTFGNLAQTNTTDFDSDGLTDWYEYRNGLDPKDADENDNSIPDGQEDTDGDGLTNSQEQLFGTSLTDADTDHDGVSDANEINVLGTNPFLVDTDYDGVADDFDAFPFDPQLQRLSSAGGPPVIQLLTPANAQLVTVP